MSDEIAKSIINKLGKEGMEYLQKNGELPEIKLSPEEMNFIKGGARPIGDVLKDFWDFINGGFK